jgi:hypothetical protein
MPGRTRGKAMRTSVVAALLSASIAWTPLSSATAQQITERQNAFEGLADNQWVRLAVPDAGRHEGRLLERSSELVVLSAEPEPLRVPATTIDTLWTRGHATKTGAIVGAVIGGALGVAAGVACNEWAALDGTCPTGSVMLLLGGIGLGGGALLGGLTGSAITKWHRRYP